MTVVFFTHSLMFRVFLVFLDMKHLMDWTLDSPQGGAVHWFSDQFKTPATPLHSSLKSETKLKVSLHVTK